MGPRGTPLDFLGLVLETLGALTWATWYARTRGGQNSVSHAAGKWCYVQVSGLFRWAGIGSL